MNITRKDAIKLAGGATATAILLGLANFNNINSGNVLPKILRPDGGAGSVTPGSIGSGWGQMTGAVYKVLYYEDNASINETYGTPSIDHFYDVLKSIGQSCCGQNPSSQTTSNLMVNGSASTIHDAFYYAANQAIRNAIRRSPEATKGRVVGFALVIAPVDLGGGRHDGWLIPSVLSFNNGAGFYVVGPNTNWTFTYDSRNVDGYDCEGYIYRAGTSSELKGSFWDAKPPNSSYANYREKFWKDEWRGDSGSDIVSMIVLAVNDYESKPSGYAKMTKKTSI